MNVIVICRYRVIEPPDGQWGIPIAENNNTFNGMVGMVINKVILPARYSGNYKFAKAPPRSCQYIYISINLGLTLNRYNEKRLKKIVGHVLVNRAICDDISTEICIVIILLTLLALSQSTITSAVGRVGKLCRISQAIALAM